MHVRAGVRDARPTVRTRRRHRHRVAAVTVTVICVLWSVPTFGVLLTSIRTPEDAATTGWWSVFRHLQLLRRLSFSSYAQAYSGNFGLGDALINSVAITVPATVFPVLFAAFAAYAFSFMHMRGRGFLFGLLVAMLVIPNQITFLPLLKLYVHLGIQGTFATVWIAQTAYGLPLAVYVIRNFMVALPREIIDASRVDGASHFQAFWRVILPMSVPILASVAIFQFLTVWNDLLVALIFIGPGPNNPLPVALGQITGQISQGGFGQLTAAATIAEIVPVSVFLLLQRFFVRGLTAVV
jgi:alpha-glucoside transport system permease protein